MVHIQDAGLAPGLACGCVCAACGVRLVARLGRRRAKHFAHDPDGPSRPCASPGETALHKAAKAVLATFRRVCLPARSSVAGMMTELHRVVCEQTRHELRPDVVATWEGRKAPRELFIEVAVTHRCGSAKVARLREIGTSAIEIDLSGCRHEIGRGELQNAVLSEAPRHWIFDARTEEERRLASELERLMLQKRARGFAQCFRSALTATHRPAAADRRIRFIETAGLAPRAFRHVAGAACFGIAAPAWQAVVVQRVLCDGSFGGRRGLTTDQLWSVLREGNAIRYGLSDKIDARMADAVRQIEPRFLSPHEVVDNYLRALVANGLVFREQEAWMPTPSALAELRGRMAAQARQRILARAIDRLVRRLPPSRRVDSARWMATPLWGQVTPEARLIADPAQYRVLLNHVTRLEAMLLPGGEPVDDILGLPLQAEQEERRREAEARKRSARSARRMAELSEQLRCSLGVDPEACLAERGILTDGTGLSQRQLERAREELARHLARDADESLSAE